MSFSTPSDQPTGRGTRYALRRATAAAHERVDALFSAHRLTDREGYRYFLEAQAAAFLPLEAAIDTSSCRAALHDWAERRRSALLRADLATLGAAVPAWDPVAPPESVAALFGLAYVLEGSRLGGQVIARTLPDDLPRQFLSASAPGQWRSFVALLDLTVTSEEDRSKAITAALEAFDMFEHSASRLEATTP